LEREYLKLMRPGEKVLVFRLAKKVWEEFNFVELEGETVTVQGRDGRKLFRTNVIKPFCDGKTSTEREEALKAMFKDAQENENSFVTQKDEGGWTESR
jgi:hypothetical protein